MPKGKLNFTERQKNKLFKDVHSGLINLMNLPKNLYNATGEELTEGVLKGSGVNKLIDIQAPANDTIRQLKKIYSCNYKKNILLLLQFMIINSKLWYTLKK